MNFKTFFNLPLLPCTRFGVRGVFLMRFDGLAGNFVLFSLLLGIGFLDTVFTGCVRCVTKKFLIRYKNLFLNKIKPTFWRKS